MSSFAHLPILGIHDVACYTIIEDKESPPVRSSSSTDLIQFHNNGWWYIGIAECGVHAARKAARQELMELVKLSQPP